MKPSPPPLSRRSTLKTLGAAGALTMMGAQPGRAADSPEATRRPRAARVGAGEARERLTARVNETTLIDTHEHLIEESDRMQGAAHPRVRCDDWTFPMAHYLDSDILTAGMPRREWDRFFQADVDPAEKWSLLEPYWPAVKNTGYGRAVRIAFKELYGVEEINAGTVNALQSGYDRVRRPGFYAEILRGQANIESCQVNCLTGEPFKESAMPTLLMQDLSIVGMFAGPDLARYAAPTGIEVGSLSDWHRVLDWWFERYGPYAVAVKSQNAYSRDIDYARVPAETAAPLFQRVVENRGLSGEDRRRLEDHLFWAAVDRATAAGLPVKLHTGYYAGQNGMPLSRVSENAASAAALCRLAPETTFVFMHICYPFYEDILAVAKHYTNACVDMCWAWIINPIAAKDFLKKYLVTAPANKLLPFGADYIPVEPVLGHARMARQGIALALAELVEEGWLSLTDAMELIDPVMHGNARRLFRLEAKVGRLDQAPWRKA